MHDNYNIYDCLASLVLCQTWVPSPTFAPYNFYSTFPSAEPILCLGWKAPCATCTNIHTHIAIGIELDITEFAHFDRDSSGSIEPIFHYRKVLQIHQVSALCRDSANQLVIISLEEDQLTHRSNFCGNRTRNDVSIHVNKT